MSRIFIARVVAIAITITAIGHTPAKADEELAGALATILGVAILGGVINNRLNDDGIERATRNIYDRTYFDNRSFNQPRFDNSLRVQPRSLPRRANRAPLPGGCLLSAGDRRVFSKGCLKRYYRFTGSLPDRCETKFRNGNGKKRDGYSASCLRRAGYSLALR